MPITDSEVPITLKRANEIPKEVVTEAIVNAVRAPGLHGQQGRSGQALRGSLGRHELRPGADGTDRGGAVRAASVLPGHPLLAEGDVPAAIHRENGWTSRRDRSLPRQQAMPFSSLGRKTCSPTTASATFEGVAVAKDYERLHQLETP